MANDDSAGLGDNDDSSDTASAESMASQLGEELLDSTEADLKTNTKIATIPVGTDP
jgi:hypothetical protein